MKYVEQGIVGDQLTVERGVSAIFEMDNGFAAKNRHDGTFQNGRFPRWNKIFEGIEI